MFKMNIRNAGRKKDDIWNNFVQIPNENKTGTRAKCKLCGVELQGLVERLKTHSRNCTSNDDVEFVETSDPGGDSGSMPSVLNNLNCSFSSPLINNSPSNSSSSMLGIQNQNNIIINVYCIVLRSFNR